ncbi:SIS domain-containing protein [Dehalococcoidia bacterium]|nr:SIS domain-containing protein [Dehalococcoidia bacterium]
MNNLEKIFSESRSVRDYAKGYVSYLSELLTSLNSQAIEEIIEVFQNVRANGKTIFFAGNGGSAATCSHFAEDLSYGTMAEGKKPFKALSLTDNAAYMTAVANDEGYENIFVRQLRNLFNTGDVLVAISGSGNSPNVVKAIEYANSKGGITIGIVGFDGGKVKNICHHCVHIKTMKGEYGPVEDIHLILAHLVTTYLGFKLREG